MMTVILLISLVFTFAYLTTWVQFQKYQFLERDYNIVVKHKEYSKLWHLWKGANQAVFFVLIGYLFGWQLALINAFTYWILFDGFLNILVLNRGFFYIGYTSWIDRALRSTMGFINKLVSPISTKLAISSEFLSFVLKTVLLIGSLYIYYI